MAEFSNMDFNTYPKDLLPCSEVRVLLKSALKNFNPKHIPAALFNQNSGLSGSLRLHSSKPVIADARSKKNERKDGWRLVSLKGNGKFFDSLRKFPDSFPFSLGCSSVCIRGGSGRDKNGFSSGRNFPFVPSSSTSASSSAPGIASVPVSLSSIMVPAIQSDIVMTAEEMRQLLPVPSSAVSSGGPSTSSSSASGTLDDLSHRPTPASSASAASTSGVASKPKPVKPRKVQPQSQPVASSASAPASQGIKVRGGKGSGKGKGRGCGFSRGKKTSSSAAVPGADFVDTGASSLSPSLDTNDQVFSASQ